MGEVVLTLDAERDLEELFEYVSEFDSRARADHLLERVLEVAASLARNPKRGSVPKELRALGMHDYRQLFFKPYRIICRVMDDRVLIYLIADGRRDMESLLARRLLSD